MFAHLGFIHSNVFVLNFATLIIRFQMMKMIRIQTLIRHPYLDGVIKHDWKGWKSARKNRRNI